MSSTPKDDGAAAEERLRATLQDEEEFRADLRFAASRTNGLSYSQSEAEPWWVADDEPRTYLHGDPERGAFREKLAEWRRSGSIFSYTGPRAGRG